MNAKPCPAHGCTNKIPVAHLFCEVHWLFLPSELCEEIALAWVDRKDNTTLLRLVETACRQLKSMDEERTKRG